MIKFLKFFYPGYQCEGGLGGRGGHSAYNQLVEILIILYIPKCMLETAFHGQKTNRLVRGSLSCSETPYFHKGGPLRMVPMLPLSAEM